MTVIAKIGALLFVIWGVLHVWVAYDGLETYYTVGVKSNWQHLIGGRLAPFSATPVVSEDPQTLYALGGLIRNFVLDVGGYGVLGFFVAYKLWTEASWFAYWIGLVCIGIADLSFLFVMVYPGEIIELSFPVLLGPIIWFLAVAITPFGLKSSSSSSASKSKKKLI